jgi:hypothetical protein
MNTLTFKKQIIKMASPLEEKHYFEIVVSGQTLSQILGLKPGNLITPFGWGVNDQYEKTLVQIFTFRKKSDLESGRVMLYVCPACGDIGCGAITCNIIDKGDKIIWSNFDFENGDDGVTAEYKHIEPIVFSRQNYFKAFQQLK